MLRVSIGLATALICSLSACGDDKIQPSSSPDAGRGQAPDYTIGGDDGDFSSFGEAIDALAAGMLASDDDELVFSVRPGEYSELVLIPPTVTDALKDNSLFFVGENDNVIINGDGIDDFDVMVTIDGVSRVEFRNIKIADAAEGGNPVEIGFLITGGAHENVIRDCDVILGDGVNPLTRGVVLLSTFDEVSGTATNNNNNRIDGLKVDGVATGIEFWGPTSADPFDPPLFDHADTGNQILNSQVGLRRGIGLRADGFASTNGIFVRDQVDVSVLGNTIKDVEFAGDPMGVTNITGVFADRISGRIADNTIQGVRFDGPGGSILSGMRASPHMAGPLLLANNMISKLSRRDFAASPTDPSIYLLGIWALPCFTCSEVREDLLIRHNTIVIETPGGVGHPTTAFQLRRAGGELVVRMRANIFVNQVTGGGSAKAFGLIDDNSLAERQFLDSNDNVIFVSGEGAILARLQARLGQTPMDAQNMAQWQGISSGDLDSVDVEPLFVDLASGDLHLNTEFATSDASRSVSAYEEKNDIDGDLRDTANPNRGADELP